jgi:hypothetical protein
MLNLSYSIPTEILIIIIRLLVVRHEPIIIDYKPTKSQYTIIRDTLHVCKYFHAVTEPILYGENKFEVEQASCDLEYFLQSCSQRAYNVLSQLRLRWPLDSWRATPSLDLIVGCPGLTSLVIHNNHWGELKLTQENLKFLRALRLQHLELPDEDKRLAPNYRRTELSKEDKKQQTQLVRLKKLVQGRTERTRRQQDLVDVPRDIRVSHSLIEGFLCLQRRQVRKQKWRYGECKLNNWSWNTI